MNKTLTALKGVRVGHSTHLDKLTGCTVIMFDDWYPTAYKSYGGAPGTFNTEILNNGMSFYESNGIFIAGGSLTGLMSASDIMQAMIENKIGSKDANIINPSLRGAIVFDLGTRIGQYDPRYGREAFDNLSTDPVACGNVGAGTGTAVGKFQYVEKGTKNGGMKAGVGSARVDLGNGIVICALSVVNALGNVVNPDGSILAGNRDENKKFKLFDDTTEFVTSDKMNTTITVVGINVDLGTRENYERVAHVASHGQVRAINPVHTSVDGDTVFVFSTKEIKKPLNNVGKYFETPDWPLFSVDIIGQASARAVQESIYDACNQAETISFDGAYKGVIPSVKDY
jgi:L-aminopeptidase/D-esterase-like protein